MKCSALATLFALVAAITTAANTPRERISINENWRFTKGDPNGDPTGLIYDVRPEVKDKKDDKAADSERQGAICRT